MTGYKSPPRKRTTIRVQNTYTILRLAAAQYGLGMTWKAIGAQIGVSAPVVRRAVAEGIYPDKPAIRARLGLPVMAPAPICLHCGVPHVTKRCTAKAVKPRKPRRTRKRRNLLNLELGRAWLALGRRQSCWAGRWVRKHP